MLHSTRRGYWYAPKYAFGKPSDQVNDLISGLRTPMWLKQRLMHATIRLTVGDHAKLGLPRPDHTILQTHPIANSLLPYYVGQGDITPVPDLVRFDGRCVELADGARVEVDLVVLRHRVPARLRLRRRRRARHRRRLDRSSR